MKLRRFAAWIAMIFPTYRFLDPIIEVAIGGATLSDVWLQLLVAATICCALIPLIGLLARRMQAQIAASRGPCLGGRRSLRTEVSPEATGPATGFAPGRLKH